jgi:two-component system, NtrC family, response regulator HydG
MVTLQQQIEKVAETDASVLLLGENGTGKEVIAREIHRRSTRRDQVFISVDLSSLTPTLFESELFGHKKGAFTDARDNRIGRFESATGGTLFLDEIGNLAIPQQAKLLTALQSREVIPVGSNTPISFDVRLISATNAQLLQMSEQSEFRQDLLYRINTITLHVPPLRDRAEDIMILARHFFERYREQYARAHLQLSPDIESIIREYKWPGNVRELQHTMEKAVILCSGSVVTADDLNLSISGRTGLVADRKSATAATKTLDEIEKEALLEALKHHSGNILHASKALGITRQTLYNKMKKYGI